MSEFKVNKPKALLNAMTKVAYDKSEAFITQLAATHPSLTKLLVLTQASFGVLIAYKQEKLNQFVEFLMEHEEIFTKEKINRVDFQDGMIIFLEQYFKLRSDGKLKLAQNIFLDFAESPKMPDYPLERLNDTLQKISDEGIQFLGFIDSEVPKLQREHAIYKGNQNNNDISEENLQNLVKIYANEPINFFIEKYVDKQVLVAMREYKGSEPLTEEKKIKDELMAPFSPLKSELEQLGIAKINYVGGTIGGSEREYFNLTDYGKKFVSIIRPNEI